MPTIKTRFAPSPTGLLHFGNVRTALFNALLAKKESGTFLLRIEDTDLERSSAEFSLRIEHDLDWLGINWQEGGSGGGPHAPYYQSQRVGTYQRYLDELEAQGRVYPCFCTAVELEVSRKIQAASGKPPRYSGKCAHLSPAEVEAKRAQGLSFTTRFRMPKSQPLDFDDLVRGPQHFSSDDIGDFIVRRSDGNFAFFFVNAIDDALMEITHVLRGEDHLTNTPRQIALLRALGLAEPKYGHISLIVNQAGAPLSKRSGSLAIEELERLGYFPLAINNYLARLGHHYADNRLLDMPSLAEQFSLEHLGRAPARYDRAQLDHWQTLAVQQADETSLLVWLAPALADLVPADQRAAFAAAVRANIVFPSDAQQWAQAIYTDPLPVSEDARKVLHATGAGFFDAALKVYDDSMDFKALATAVKSATGASGKNLFLPLRAALTGQVHGPEMPAVYALLGARARHRLEAWA